MILPGNDKGRADSTHVGRFVYANHLDLLAAHRQDGGPGRCKARRIIVLEVKMEMRAIGILTFALSAALFGCAANSGVIPMGAGTFMVARQAATGFGGIGNLKADAVKDANAYCAELGQDFEVTNTTQNEGPFILGKYPRAEVTFRCVPRR